MSNGPVPRRWRIPRTAGFSLAAALMDGAVMGTGLVLTLWLDRDWQVDAAAIGGVAAVGNVAYMLAVVGMGHLADRLGARRMALVSVLLNALVLWLLPFQAGWGLLVGLVTLRGIFLAMFWPSLAGWIARGADAATLPRRMAAYNLGWGTGYLLGPWLAALLFERFGAGTTFHLCAVVLLLNAVVVALLPTLSGTRATPAPVGDRAPETSHRDERRQAWISDFAAAFCAGAALTHFPQYARLTLDWSPAQVGTALSVLTGANLIAFVYLGLIRPELASGRLVPASRWLALAGLLALVAARPVLAIAGLLTIGLHQGAAFTASFYHSLYGRPDTARQGGIHEVIVGSGSFFGVLLVGLAMQLSLDAGWVSAALVLLLSAGLARRAVA